MSPVEGGQPIATVPHDSDTVIDVWCDECNKWITRVRRVEYGKGRKRVKLFVPLDKDNEHTPGVQFATHWRPTEEE